MFIRKNSLNSRVYALQINIAKAAKKTINKIKCCWNDSEKTHGDCNINRPDTEYIFFTPEQLRMICFDYTFAALENFLEHIGYILFSDWDSKKKQKSYFDKKSKLLLIHEAMDKEHQPHLDCENLEVQWRSIIEPMNPEDYSQTRNPIKHTHTGKHEIKTLIITTDDTTMNQQEHEQLISGTPFALTDEECDAFLKKTEDFITEVWAYVDENKLMFRIYCESSGDEQIDKRRELLGTFLTHPFATTFCSSVTTTK